MSSNNQIALYVDYDNVQLCAEKLDLRHCGGSHMWAAPLVRLVEVVFGGEVVVRRAYGTAMLNAAQVFREKEWNPRQIRALIETDVGLQHDLATNGFQMIHCQYAGAKNRADILISLDCLELATRAPHIGTHVVMSNDSDFAPLIQRLRELGKHAGVATVTAPHSKGRPVLLAMATNHVEYGQAAVDALGYDLLAKTIQQISSEKPEIFTSGLPVSNLQARFYNDYGGFSEQALGFNRFSDFLEACLQEPYVIRDNRVFGGPQAPPPARRDAPPRERPPQPIARPMALGEPAAREAQITAALTKANFKPVPEVRRPVAMWLRETAFDDEGKPLEKSLIFGDLVGRVEARFCAEGGFSKTRVREAMNVLSKSGALVLESVGAYAESPVVELVAPDEARRRIAGEAFHRLFGNGWVVGEADVEPLARVLFGADSIEGERAIREGLAMIEDATEEVGELARAGW